jgi:hypothetical protein
MTGIDKVYELSQLEVFAKMLEKGMSRSCDFGVGDSLTDLD